MMLRDVVGFLLVVLGVVGTVSCAVKSFQGMGRQRALQARLRGLTFSQRRVMTRFFRRGENIPSTLQGAARPLAEQLAGSRLLAWLMGSLALSMAGLLVQPSPGPLGAVLHVWLGAVLAFIAVVAVVAARRSSAGRRYLRVHKVSSKSGPFA